MDKYKVGIVSLGCDKNRIDTEIVLEKVSKEYELTTDAKNADIIIVNTCGFIEKSKQESINTILEMAEYKNKYKCKLLIATGCLTQRYGKELLELMPEIDILLGVNDYEKLNEYINDFIKNQKKIVKCNYSNEIINEGNRIISTQKHTAYVRIAEGCDNFCTYCIIPKIRGKYRSRKLENIVDEVNELARKGVKEVILVAQDTTRYGIDIYGEKKLPELIDSISKIKDIKWIRVLYCYPEEITRELINVLKENIKVCKYLDIPIQHASNEVLKRMGRKTDKESITSIIDSLREQIPNIVLRTSIIVGFPGETNENFEELKDFVAEYKFDKLGVFTYSQEEDTPAALMKDQIDEEIKKQREEELMLLQKNISKEINSKKVGKVYEVIAESFDGGYYEGRSSEMAPDIDGSIIFKSDLPIKIGDIVSVKITKTLEYDLIGVVQYESC